jgi:hypothetical protein
MITVAYWLTMLAGAGLIVALRRALVRELRRARAFRPRHDLRMARRHPHWQHPTIAGRDRDEHRSSLRAQPPARPAPRHRAPWALTDPGKILAWRTDPQHGRRRLVLAPAPGSSWFWRPVSF